MSPPDPARLQVGTIVLLIAFDDVPEHLFEIHSVEEDCVTGIALSGPFKGEYGEPAHTMIKAICQGYLQRPGLVFHSTRKWFITQCERTGVPEHFTASLVGHKSARSESKLTYGIYSAGISDEQKRAIVDQVQLPAEVAA